MMGGQFLSDNYLKGFFFNFAKIDFDEIWAKLQIVGGRIALTVMSQNSISSKFSLFLLPILNSKFDDKFL